MRFLLLFFLFFFSLFSDFCIIAFSLLRQVRKNNRLFYNKVARLKHTSSDKHLRCIYIR